MYNNLLTENNYHCIKVISKRIRHYLKNQVNNLKINKSKGNTAIRFPLLYPTLDFCVLAKLEKKNLQTSQKGMWYFRYKFTKKKKILKMSTVLLYWAQSSSVYSNFAS